MKEKDSKLNDRTVQAVTELSSRLALREFIDPRDFVQICSTYEQLDRDIRRRKRSILFRLGIVDKQLKSNFTAFSNLYDIYPEHLRKHNDNLAQTEATEAGECINPIEGYDLDKQQLTAVAYDVKSRLIIAGAGTGKTTTIVGLMKYLLKTGKATPEEILALSFINASVDDMKKRISAETGKRMDVSTFHRLGLKIIASVEGKVPKISNLKLDEFVADEIKRRRTDARFVRGLNEFIGYDLESYGDEDAFDSSSELIDYLNENPLITNKGEKVKSFGEADIANCLALNGIEYTYEESYCVDANDLKYGQYHPDFHINGTNIYIEYFGTDRKGNVAKFMIDKNPDASEKYREGMEWKRATHRQYGTRLIELYAYERSEGTLIESLESKLREYDVSMNQKSPEEIFDKTFGSDNRMLSFITSTFTTAILLIKGFGKPWDEVYPIPKNLREIKSLRRIASVLKPIYDSYQHVLAERNEIDFEDMLNLAAEYIREGKYTHHYRYVIVDEYQDLSRSRYNLLKALRDSEDFHLFCVGDDWQSIYRFNGCDVSYILNFEKYWGPSVVCKIERTYRFSGELLKMSSKFIQKNDRQYRKDMVGVGGKDSKVSPIVGEDDSQIREEIGRKLAYVEKGKTVLFLGRYNHDVRILNGDGFEWKQNISDNSKKIVYSGRPDLDMKFMTIHSSKGLQADVVFSLNNTTGRYGFPSVREEPAIIQMLLGGENSQIDEERRLFYVAMTRAKESVYIVSKSGRQSVFFKELFLPVAVRTKKVRMTCPWCGGDMVLRTNRNGSRFYGCSNFGPRGCKYTVNCESTNSKSKHKRRM